MNIIFAVYLDSNFIVVSRAQKEGGEIEKEALVLDFVEAN